MGYHVSIIVLILVLTKNISSSLLIELNSTYKQKDIVDAASEIAKENFNYKTQTVLVAKDVDGVVVDNFLKAFKGTVVIEVKRDGLPPRQVVIILKSYRSFKKILNILKPDLKGKTLLHSGARFIIVILVYSHRIGRIFHILWSYYTTDVVILQRQKNHKIALYTYYPFKNKTNCQNTELHFIGFWNGSNLRDIELYQDKMKNMNKCPFYISTNKLYHKATEQKIPLQIIKKTMVRLLQEVMNFTPIISTKDYISIDSDRAQNWSESLNDVITAVANISICSISLAIDRVGLLDYSLPYFKIRVVWLAPPTTSGSVLWHLFSPLNGYLWLVLLIVVFFVKSIPFILKTSKVKKFSRRYFKGINKLRGVSFRIWGVMVGQPVKMAPKRFRDFYIISLWVWFTFVVRNAYQSVLIGALKTDSIEGSFASFKEAVENGYKFGGRAGILVHFEHEPLIRDKFEIIPEAQFETTFDDILSGRKRFIIATTLEYAYAYCLTHSINENECGHLLPDSILTIPLVIWMQKHSPFMRSISLWLQRLLESGLLEREILSESIGASKKQRKTTDPTPLTRDQTLSYFICLIFGYIISIIVFTLEKMTIRLFNILNVS